VAEVLEFRRRDGIALSIRLLIMKRDSLAHHIKNLAAF
jgi:hypothetical protein